jgi:hypothetical protein
MIREGDDINNWQELFTIETIATEGPRLPPDDFLREIQALRENKCPGVTKWNVLTHDSRSILYEWQATPCLGWPDQHEIARVIYGEHDIFQLRYTVKVYKMPAERRSEMIKRLSEASAR